MEWLLVIKVLLLLKLFCYVDSQFMPGMPSPMGGMSFPQMPQMSGMPQMPMNGGAMSMPMPGMHPGMGMPMQIPLMSQPKLPVVVMPFNKQKNNEKRRSKNKSRNKRRKHRSKKHYDLASSYSDRSSESYESEEDSSRDKRHNSRSLRSTRTSKRRQVLTPVISYVTKDGYVVYQKKIKKEKAKDWLNIGRKSNAQEGDESREKLSSSIEVLRKVIKKEIQKIKNKRA